MKTAIKDELINEAKRVRQNAYAPYSKFKVGAAVLGEDSKIYTGCNVENVALGLSICAERSAIVHAFSEGCRHMTHIAIVTDHNTPCSPCGICRQVLYEFNPDMIVYLANLEGQVIEKTAKELLPLAFERLRLE
ncbi:MAG: cytidine deaminase [Actinobacteria bacterium]|nr:MAG: cytidine deaminase [Actinomycetota bacterium]